MRPIHGTRDGGDRRPAAAPAVACHARPSRSPSPCRCWSPRSPTSRCPPSRATCTRRRPTSIWVVNAYQLAVTVTLLPFASIGDIYGHRRVYVWGLAVYTAASLLCAVAPSLPVLVIGRVLQGFGGAGIMSVNGALVRFIYPRAELGRGIGFNALVVAGSSTAGPSVAAAIMSVLSWPWLFALQVPAGHRRAVAGASLPAANAARRPSVRSAQRGAERDHLRPVHHRAGRHRTRPGAGDGADRACRQHRGRLVLRASPVHAGGADAAGRSVPPPGVRAVGGDRDLCARRAAHRLRVAAVLLPVRQRAVADPDRRADHAVARRAGGHGADRRPAGGSVLRGTARRIWPGGDDAGSAAGAVPAARARRRSMSRGGSPCAASASGSSSRPTTG